MIGLWRNIMFKNPIPNFVMLRLMLVSTMIVQRKYPDLEQMPMGHICPGYDIRMMRPIAVLRYLLGVKTQWSCQGTHKSSPEHEGESYILLAPEHSFPDDLIRSLRREGFGMGLVGGDIDENMQSTGRLRAKISAEKVGRIVETIDGPIYEASGKTDNAEFLRILDEWAISHIRGCLSEMNVMRKDPYYKDLVTAYDRERIIFYGGRRREKRTRGRRNFRKEISFRRI
jgi:hypothetical protein